MFFVSRTMPRPAQQAIFVRTQSQTGPIVVNLSIKLQLSISSFVPSLHNVYTSVFPWDLFCTYKVGGKAVDAMTVIGTDKRGDPKLAGETAVCGKWKGAFAMRLQQSQFDLHCSTVSFSGGVTSE